MSFKISVLKKFRNIHKKLPVLESIFNKVAGLKASNFIKKETPAEVFLREYCGSFKKQLFLEHLRWLLLEIFILISILLKWLPKYQ